MKNKVIFLDRDGIINKVVKNERGQYDSPLRVEDVELVIGIEKIIRYANKNNILVVEITNQPAVAKGKMTMKVCQKIEDKIDRLLLGKEAVIDKKYICYHQLLDNCTCRKPKPGMLLQAAKDLNIDLNNSLILGDRDWDIMAGKAVGCKTILYMFDDDNAEKIKFAKESNPDFKVWSMDETLIIIKKLFLCKQ